ncbi:MAG: hypothetical protein PHG48_02940 [Eubacteriales bacterium]|nr:hypothetical protein [Eubacteriales bacterium]
MKTELTLETRSLLRIKSLLNPGPILTIAAAIALLSFTFSSLSGCSLPGSDPSVSLSERQLRAASADALEGKVSLITLGGINIEDFKILINSRDDITSSGIAEGISQYIYRISGIHPGIIEDSYEKKSPEIIVGSTSREDAPEGNKDVNEYAIYEKDGDLYISYGNRASGQRALDAFIELALAGSAVIASGSSENTSSSDKTHYEIAIAEGYNLKGRSVTPEEQYGKTALIAYPEYDERIPRDYTYTVSVYQDNISFNLPVYNHTSSDLINSPITESGEKRRFCEFAFCGRAVRVDIAVRQDVQTYTIMPSAKNFRTEMKDNVISVWLDKPETFMLKIDGNIESLLTVFADLPEPECEIPSRYSSTAVCIDNGWEEPSDRKLTLTYKIKNLYVAPGSVLCARVGVYGSDCIVSGRGIILDPYSNIFETNISMPSHEYLLTVHNKNVNLKDIKLVDARTFNVVFDTGSDGGRAKNIRILSTVICSDGLSIWNAGDVHADGCYIHCGDNAVVVRAYDNVSVTNTIIGTICAALVPSWEIGENTVFRDIYIFRSDGDGIIKSYTSWKDITLDHGWKLEFDNINAVDCDRLSYIFVARDTAEFHKQIIMRNIVVPELGSGSTYSRTNTAISISYQGSIRPTSNYHLEIENLFVGGKLITNVSELKTSYDNTKNSVQIAVSPAKTPIDFAAAPATKAVNYIYPYKVYIGSSEQIMRSAPVLSEGMIYLPFEEIAVKTGYNYPASASDTPDFVNSSFISEINGKAMISIDDISSVFDGFSASYDAGSGGIVISEVSEGSSPDSFRKGLLYEPYTGLSRWCEAVAYRTTLTAYKTDSIDGARIYEMHLAEYVSSMVGMRTYVTDELKKNSGGLFSLEFDARCIIGKSQYMKVNLRTYMERNYLDKSLPFTCSNSWQHFTFTFQTGGSEYLENISAFNLGIYFGNGLGTKAVQIKNMELSKIN